MSDLIGVDECGVGSLCGPMFCVGVRAPTDWKIDGLKDSKKLTPKQRQTLHDRLMECAEKQEITYYLTQRTHLEIDRMNIYQATRDAHMEVFRALGDPAISMIVDGNMKYPEMKEWQIQSMIKADTQIPHCMAASIIAKVKRDVLLKELAQQYPQYGWEKNAGYYCKEHIEAIYKYGPTELHRRSFNPVKEMLK